LAAVAGWAESSSVSIAEDNAAEGKPQIPKHDFEWKGTFEVASLGVQTGLTIRGRWQDGHFDLYMEQGSREDAEVWVENLIYKNKLYTITHRWPGGINVPLCFKSQNDITVDNLNGILRSSRLVDLEVIDGVEMNHFRTTCLSKTALLFPPVETRLNIFSDIYTQPGSPDRFERWLQFGDGVGLDPQQDEWFFFSEHSEHAKEIHLPFICRRIPIPVLQEPCSNLIKHPDY
jgi:hypothetical protein